jgi:hypothetical protein
MALPQWHRHDAPMRPWSIPPRAARRLMRSTVPVLAFAFVVPASGCCSLARLFCGPDKSKWVSVDHSRPEATVQTLLEALRRDDPEQVYWTLSSALRARLGLTSLNIQVAWQTFREQYPWLHVAGYADVPAARRLGEDAARIEFEIEGYTVVVDLVRTTQWFVHYRRPAFVPDDPERVDATRFGSLGSPGQYVEPGVPLFTLTADETDPKSTLVLRPLVFAHEGLDELSPGEIEAAGFRREWKIDHIDRLQLPDAP